MWMLPDSLKCSPRYQCCFKGWGQPEFWHLTVRDPGEEASGPLSRKASKRQKNFSPLLILILIQFTYQPWYRTGYELLFWAVYWYDHHLRLGRRRSILQWQGHRPRFPGYKEIFVPQAKILLTSCEQLSRRVLLVYTSVWFLCLSVMPGLSRPEVRQQFPWTSQISITAWQSLAEYSPSPVLVAIDSTCTPVLLSMKERFFFLGPTSFGEILCWMLWLGKDFPKL